MIAIVDYGMGNLRSVSKALEHLGAKVSVTSSPRDILKADKVVLPGVGAFGDAVEGLKTNALLDPLREYIKLGKPFLGICLGLQLLFHESEESPSITGLDVYSGKVQGFRSRGVKVPHMGWNQIHKNTDHPLLRNIPDESYFYFVHSFYAAPQDASVTAATCEYGQEKFAVAVGKDHVFATQFHPEKSQKAGLNLLQNFVKW
ncbi:MAG TPA: imidazole glycerol phosphate synthase subunit HisH [Verrucomicrobiae bacterium]|jgi:glutamine amidotransferase|nr:imidazole glycerol phosphate synthase subunit HisH [Verrucomicrobiae bacterium]